MQTITERDALVQEVRAGLARRSLTQDDLALRLGLTRQAVGRRLTGKVPFTHPEVRDTADLLGVTIASLYGEKSAA